MKVNECIFASKHYLFLNCLLKKTYKAFYKSGLTLPDGKWLWMIRLGNFVSDSGWINRLEAEECLIEEHVEKEFFYEDHHTYVEAAAQGIYVPSFEDRAVFEIVDFANTRKYIFRGIFTLNTAECTATKNVWKRIADEYEF